MIRPRLDPLQRSAPNEWLLAALLGACGFALNLLELQLGWGMHFIFGNALIFSCLRTMRPKPLIAAASLSSLRSIFLWHHPWAWAIWTLEAALLAGMIRRSSPIRTDVVFWVLVGTPLLIITYGGFMHMDSLSVLLVVAKQATNGVLNVALGEILYIGFLGFSAARNASRWPRIPIEAFVLTILVSIILIPTTVYLSLDAPAREQGARRAVGSTLDDRLQVASATLRLWQQSRSLMLEALADQRASQRVGPAVTGEPPLQGELRAEFDQIAALDADGRTLWSIGSAGRLPARRDLRAATGARLVEIDQPTVPGRSQLALVVPSRAARTGPYIVARLRANTLEAMVTAQERQSIDGMFLTSPASRTLTINAASPTLGQLLRTLPVAVREAAHRDAVLLSKASYGSSLMSDLKDAMMVRAMPIAGLPGWDAIAVARLSGEVLKAREGQLQLFTALCAFVILVTATGSLLARRIELSLRELAQSAADLAITGTGREQIDSLVIRELSDISIKIATVGSQVARERGALVSYQRRLRSIAQHAPVVVYALDVSDGRKGDMTYVSEALERILGYTPDEASRPGWWSHAVHPDDYDRCNAVFADLRPGTAISLEYRLRHKRGHYVWIYDNLAVEAEPAADATEAVGLIIDISDRKLATEQLQQADKMASLGRMVAGIAHELNQPLNFIKLAALNLRERTARGLVDPERFTAKLENILGHVNRASAIILQMRVFGRKPSEAPHPMALKDAVDAVMTMIGPQLEAEGIAVDTSGCAADVTVLALPVLLEQVLLNLLLNAHDAIRARQAGTDNRPGWIGIGVGRQGDHAMVTVEDNGTGLANDVLPALFDPFFTTKPPKEGAGLGLSISYGIVRDLGGAIRAENADAGARFVIELPLCA